MPSNKLTQKEKMDRGKEIVRLREEEKMIYKEIGEEVGLKNPSYVSDLYHKWKWQFSKKEHALKPLNAKEEVFCQLYTGKLFGNGTDSAEEAWQLDNRNSANALAARVLKKKEVNERITELMREKYHLDDEQVAANLNMLILQNQELHTKLGAIKEYNRVKGKVPIAMLKVLQDIEGYEDEEIEAEIKRRENKTAEKGSTGSSED